MDDLNLTLLFAGVVSGAAPIVLAPLGETITEKSGFGVLWALQVSHCGWGVFWKPLNRHFTISVQSL